MSLTSSAPYRLASRLDDVGFSDIVNIRNKIMELRAGGASVFQFEGGEPFSNTPEHIKEAMTHALHENKTRYAPSSGIMELRTAIADKLRERNSIAAKPEDVIVLNGGMQGLFGAFQSVVDPDDEVLVFSPFWTPIKDLIAHCSGRTILVPTADARREGFEATLARYATDKTRAIYYNTPQNPAGIVFTRDEAEAVARFVQERDLVVIADEAYEDIVYEGEHVSIGSLDGMYERTITCFTLSKSYAMTGWRLGYTVASEPWMTGLRKTLLYSTNGVSTPTQWAALAAITQTSDFLEQTLAAFRERRELLLSGLNEIGLVAARCEAGRYHVHREHCIVEIVDEAGLPCRAGEAGRLLLTGLNNFAMPLVRYDSNDLVTAVDGPCSCGRTLPSFGEIHGRYSRIEPLPAGTLGRVATLRTALQKMPVDLVRQLRRYQIHQLLDGSFELRMVTAGNLPPAFRERVRRAWSGLRLSVRVRFDAPVSSQSQRMRPHLVSFPFAQGVNSTIEPNPGVAQRPLMSRLV